MAKRQNYFVIRKDKRVFFDNEELEDVEFNIHDGVLTVKGNQIMKDFQFENAVTDEKELEKIEEKFIKEKTIGFFKWKRKVRYVPALIWYNFKKREKIIYKSSCWTFIDETQPEEVREFGKDNLIVS